ncbi:MAG: isochorismatase family protein [Janthinobacterium lividum]
MNLAVPANHILENAVKLVEAFRKAKLPIVVVNVNPTGAVSSKVRKVINVSLPPDFNDDWFKIHPQIKTQPDDIFITKQTWNAFYRTVLDEELKKRNITQIVLAGVATSIGIEGTARAANERGYNIAFAQDAMTDRIAEAHENSLKYIFPRIGEIGNTIEIIEKLG